MAILIPFLIPEDQNPMAQLGIYGAVVKVAVLMNMFIQAFRYAFEPFFFSQKRVGYREKVFNLFKLKSMTDARNENGELLSDEKRLTALGKFLRKTSLDEIPQLINVLKGDMSLVGPRPLLVQYLALYTDEQKRRHLVKPGITGWAQINGRNAISWEEKFKLDVWYVDNQSFWLDMKIIWLTIRKVLVREGINQEGQATMKPFKGN